MLILTAPIHCRGSTVVFWNKPCGRSHPEGRYLIQVSLVISFWTPSQTRGHIRSLFRPGFGELGQSLKALLYELPPLEASNEAHYINLGLESASDHRDSAETLESEVEKSKPHRPA
ncbi:hypothetical protein cypCar_00002001 [Cyprinus carpio]|nr:hypothetical protein cypCar_00002001 [Cyprinus carpio]